jgi:hypothetical protein
MVLKGEMADVHSRVPRIDSRYNTSAVFIRCQSRTNAGPGIGCSRE